MSWYRCIVNDCNGKDSDEIHLYRFPTKNPIMMKMWCQNLRISRSSIEKRSAICSRHFEPSNMGVKNLKYDAVPTVNLGHSRKVTHFTPTRPRRKCIRECAIISCQQTSRDATLHNFPLDPEKRKAWMKVCNLRKYGEAYAKKLFICNRHFDLKHIKVDTRRLTSEAFPKFYLNEDEDLEMQSLTGEVDAINSDEDIEIENHLLRTKLEIKRLRAQAFPEIYLKKQCLTQDSGTMELDEELESENDEVKLDPKGFQIYNNNPTEIEEENIDQESITEDDFFLPKDELKNETNTSFTSATKPKRKCIRLCAIASCEQTSAKATLHTFPLDSEKRKAWMEVCSLKKFGEAYAKNIYICNRHFDPKHIKTDTRRLTFEAFPTFYLHEDTDLDKQCLTEDIGAKKADQDLEILNDDAAKFVQEVFEVYNEDVTEMDQENDIDHELYTENDVVNNSELDTESIKSADFVKVNRKILQTNRRESFATNEEVQILPTDDYNNDINPEFINIADENDTKMNGITKYEDPLTNKGKLRPIACKVCLKCKRSNELSEYYKNRFELSSLLLKNMKNENERNKAELNYFKNKNQSLKKTVLSLSFELSRLQRQQKQNEKLKCNEE